MKASILYRIAALLLLLFAAGHTLGFNQPPDPQWHADNVVGAMQSVRFDIMGSSRTYWDLFLGAGYSLGILYLFAALLAWQLGGLPAAARAGMRLTLWGFGLAFVLIAAVSFKYLFVIPLASSLLVGLCLLAAAWRSGREAQ